MLPLSFSIVLLSHLSLFLPPTHWCVNLIKYGSGVGRVLSSHRLQ